MVISGHHFSILLVVLRAVELVMLRTHSSRSKVCLRVSGTRFDSRYSLGDLFEMILPFSDHLDELVKSYGAVFGTASAPERDARSLAQVNSPLPRSRASRARSVDT